MATLEKENEEIARDNDALTQMVSTFERIQTASPKSKSCVNSQRLCLFHSAGFRRHAYPNTTRHQRTVKAEPSATADDVQDDWAKVSENCLTCYVVAQVVPGIHLIARKIISGWRSIFRTVVCHRGTAATRALQTCSIVIQA